MRFKNEKEFEFNVYKVLEAHGVKVDILEEPFDARIGKKYIEFKMSKWNPKYHHPMISFTRGQTVDMLNGMMPIVLVCGTSSFYLLSGKKLKELINLRRKWKHIWISEKYFQDAKMTYEQMIACLRPKNRKKK